VSDVPVSVACPCPGTPHPDGDTVYLHPKLGLAAGIAVQKLIIEANQSEERLNAAELTGVLAEGYLLYGVTSWTLLDEQGKPLPVNRDTIRAALLEDFTVGAPIADVADDLYMGPVLLPLVKRASNSSPSSPTNGSTSARKASTRKRQKPSKQSSTTTSQTGVTATTSQSPGGDYSSSPSLVSVGG
jgi:hypothetical protein